MSASEEMLWQRFFKIFGPTGDRRLDENFAGLRKTLHWCHGDNEASTDDLTLKYDWKAYFPKEDDEILAEAVNFEKDFAVLQRKFGKSKTGQCCCGG